MLKINYKYSLSSDWHIELVEKLQKEIGAEKMDEKLVMMPKNIAEGGFYFTEVAQGISAIIWDVVFKEPTLITREKSADKLHIIHYDFSDEMNLMHIENVQHKIGYKANLGLGVFDNAVENIFQPVVGERVFAMRLLVDKELLNFPFANGRIKIFKRKSTTNKEVLFYFDHIDSESKLIMNDFKTRAFTDPAFEIYFRGIALRLFANFIDRYSNNKSMVHHISDREAKVLNNTKDFLLNSLLNKFPEVDFLADMAGMSITKYKYLFKKMFVDPPGRFFNREKMLLAKELLKSGEFDSVDDVCRYLKYKKKSTFSSKYYKQFGRKPKEDLSVFG